MIGSGSALSK